MTRCLICTNLGTPHRVFVGLPIQTIMGDLPGFFGAEPRLHTHRRRPEVTRYVCNHGHAWKVEAIKSCWCGWPETPKGIEHDLV